MIILQATQIPSGDRRSILSEASASSQFVKKKEVQVPVVWVWSLCGVLQYAGLLNTKSEARVK